MTDLARQIGLVQLGQLGGWVTVRCPRDLDPPRAGGEWDARARRWLMERRRIGPVLRELERMVDPLFWRAGIRTCRPAWAKRADTGALNRRSRITMRRPREHDAIVRRAGDVWEPGARQWLVEGRRIGPVLRKLERTVDPLFRRAGIPHRLDLPGQLAGAIGARRVQTRPQSPKVAPPTRTLRPLTQLAS